MFGRVPGFDPRGIGAQRAALWAHREDVKKIAALEEKLGVNKGSEEGSMPESGAPEGGKEVREAIQAVL